MNAKKLRIYRTALGMQQSELAAQVGISQAHLCRIERGRVNAGEKSKQKISQVLGLPVESLFTEGKG